MNEESLAPVKRGCVEDIVPVRVSRDGGLVSFPSISLPLRLRVLLKMRSFRI